MLTNHRILVFTGEQLGLKRIQWGESPSIEKFCFCMTLSIGRANYKEIVALTSEDCAITKKRTFIYHD